jgi:cobalt/nickel transport protein
MERRKKMATIAAIFLTGLYIASAVGIASAHFTMLFPGNDIDVTPEDYIAEIGDTKTVRIIWGHPYEHILFDMASIPEVYVRDPEGAVTALPPTEITVEGKKAYEVSFIVDKRGDWIVYAKYEDKDQLLVDYVKAIIHCGEEAWVGWDAELGEKAEIVPFTRPYGLEESFVFTGTALYDGSALPDADVEVEMYHTKAVGDEVVAEAEEMYPYDPPMMFTRVTKTNAAGGFAYTLDEPGIWFVGAYGPEVEGLTQRSVFIIPVLEEFPTEEEVVAETPAEAATPGFSGLAAIAGLFIVVYLVKRRKD